jgi:hypothetical protein
MTVNYYPRSMWDISSLPRLGYVVPTTQFVGLAVHHTVTTVDPGVQAALGHMRRLQVERPDLGLDVPYSWVVFRGETDADSIVCEGRGAGRTGAHTYGFNSTRYGVAVVGNFMNEYPTGGILGGIRHVGTAYCPWASAPTLGHRDFPNNATVCCGDNLELQLPAVQPPFNTTPNPPIVSGDDMAMPQVVIIDGDAEYGAGTVFALDGRTAYPITGAALPELVALGVVRPPGDDSPGHTYHTNLAVIRRRFAIGPVW